MTQSTREWNFNDHVGRRSARILICVLVWIAASAAGMADPVDVKVDCTQSLCAFTYTAPDTNACTLAVTDNSGLVPSVNDVNPTLFPGANSDLSRTIPNGFRWPTLVNASGSRTLFIGGNGGSRKASDSRWYTYSLQAATQHTLTLTCGGGSSVTTVPFTTQNLPTGNYYPEPPPVDVNAPFQAQLPSIDWTNRTTSYILDHGILVRRVSSPLDFPIGVASLTNHAHAFDLNNAWTLPANPPDATHLASTSTPNAPLFLAFPFVNSYLIPAMYGSTMAYFTDFLQHLYGNGSGTVSTCISTDSGQSCASGSLLQPLSASSNTYNLPGNFPSAMFSGWGTASKPLGNWDLANVAFGNVSVAGKTVTLAADAKLNVDRPSGSKFQLSGCTSGIGNGYYTVASVDSYTQITAQETIGSASGCTYNDFGAGFRVVLTGGGTANISSTFESTGSIAMQNGSNGSHDLFSFNPVNITTDCDGQTRNPPISGYLGQMGQFGTNRVPIFLLQDDGRMCLQSTTYRPGGYLYGIENPFDSVNPLKWMMVNGTHVVLATLTSCCTEYVPGNPAPDKVAYTDVTVTATPVATQLANKGGAAATHYATGLWTQPGLAGVIGGYTLYNSVPIGSIGDAIMLRLRTDLDGNLIQAATSFDQDPMRWLCVHISPLGMGNFLETGGNACGGFNPGANLAGPWVLQLNSIHKGPMGFVPATLPVSTCTNANPIVCTAPNHGLDQFLVQNAGNGRGKGPMCNIAGLTGNWSAINGLKLCVAVGNTNGTLGSMNAFSISDPNTGAAIDGSGFGAWPGTGTFTVSPQVLNFRIGAITATKPPTLSMADDTLGGGAEACFGDGDPIGIDGFNATQFYWHKTDCSHGTLYLDQGFTQPVDNTGGAYNSANGLGIYNAETCPIGLPTSLTSGMLFDGIGAVGVRCVTVKGTGPCSWFAAPGEQAKYPCPSDPANATRSQLQDIAVGDSISDARDGYFENLRLVQKTANGDGTFNYTFMRFFGHQISAVNAGSGDNRSTGSSHQNIHQFGWQPFMIPTQTVNGLGTYGFMDVTDPTNSWKMVDGHIGNHTEIGYGKAGLTTYTGGGGSDSVANVPINFFNGYVLPNTWRFPVWNGLGSPVEEQGYPNSRQKLAPDGEHAWIADWQALNPSYGNGGGQASGLFYRTLTGPLAGTRHVYKISGPASESFNIKLTPMYGNAGPLLFRDISGTNSVIDDTKLGAMCIVLFANECVSGSAPGERYIAMSALWDPGLYASNTVTDRSPGVFQLGALMGYATQKRVDPFDISGKHWRALTRLFAAPGQHYSFQTWDPSPDAKWGFAVGSPGGAGQNWFMFRVPPWPKEDSIDRTTYVPVQVTANGDSVRVMFGYAENADPTTSLYCTTRAEACYTTTGASQSSPFVFASEPQSYTSCAGGCTINVPGISGRALFYRIERKRGTLTTLGELRFAMVP